MSKPIIVKSKKITLMKPITNADYDSKTILTKSAWKYVELWLKRNPCQSRKKALFYWKQAEHFFDASEKLPVDSRPLTSYYCCLNAAKALLSIKNISLDNIAHGVSPKKNSLSKISFDKAEVEFKGGGVLCEISRYLGESVDKQTYKIKDLIYNIPIVHRAYCITYSSQPELFVPINNIYFARNEATSYAWIEFCVDQRYDNGKALKHLPQKYEYCKYEVDGREVKIIRPRSIRFKWDIHSNISMRLKELSKYHTKIRKDIHYIYGDKMLWYIKKNISTNSQIINRGSLTLIFAVMHWLSELVRYNPERYNKLMESKQNWLVHEFVENALIQYIDEISCEITHKNIMTIGYKK